MVRIHYTFVKMPLSLEATGLGFVVFHQENNVKNLVKKLFPDGKITNEVKRVAPPVVLSGPWEVRFIDGKSNPTGRDTFTTWKLWEKEAPLVESGLIGPVKIISEEK